MGFGRLRQSCKAFVDKSRNNGRQGVGVADVSDLCVDGGARSWISGAVASTGGEDYRCQSNGCQRLTICLAPLRTRPYSAWVAPRVAAENPPDWPLKSRTSFETPAWESSSLFVFDAGAGPPRRFARPPRVENQRKLWSVWTWEATAGSLPTRIMSSSTIPCGTPPLLTPSPGASANSDLVRGHRRPRGIVLTGPRPFARS